MSTYNGEKYIKTQIDSIISQVDVSVELVIRDDGSSDATKSIVQDYGDSCVLICGNNVGCAKSFFELLRYANTNYSDDYYFAFADQDDYWMPEKLATAVRQLDAFGKSTPNLYFSNLCVVDGDLKNGKLLYNESVNLDKPHSLIQNYASGCTMVFNKKAVEMMACCEIDQFRIHDIPLFMLCLFCGNVSFDDNSYIKYRQHGGNVIGAGVYFRQRLNSKMHSLTCFWKQHDKELDAKALLSVFGHYMEEDDKKLIQKVALYRDNWKYRMELLFSSKFSKVDRWDNLWFKIRVILGVM